MVNTNKVVPLNPDLHETGTAKAAVFNTNQAMCQKFKTRAVVLSIPDATVASRRGAGTEYHKGTISLAKEPGLKQVTPLYLKAFWSLPSPKSITKGDVKFQILN